MIFALPLENWIFELIFLERIKYGEYIKICKIAHAQENKIEKKWEWAFRERGFHFDTLTIED